MADPWYFCKLATSNLSVIDGRDKPLVWIVTDARYHTDIAYFTEIHGNKIKTARVLASDNARASRGWAFVDGDDEWL